MNAAQMKCGRSLGPNVSQPRLMIVDLLSSLLPPPASHPAAVWDLKLIILTQTQNPSPQMGSLSESV